MDFSGFLILNLIVIVVLAGALIWIYARIMRKTGRHPIPVRWHSAWQQHSPRLRQGLARALPLLEIVLIVGWGVWVGRDLLVLDQNQWPTGNEYGLSIESYYTWEDLTKCGICFLWNGSQNGGSPALVELHGAPLHPLVVLSTIVLGSIDASKIVIVGSLIMAGLAQWWLARVLKLGMLPRLWSAALAVVGGHLAGRMQLGVMGLVLSTAACSLVLPPLLKVTLTGQRRATLLLAITMALALLSGQGYLQLGMIVCYGLPLLLLWIKNAQRPPRLWREYALALGLALLLAAILLVPLVHFWPNFEKDIDLTFGTAQSLEYIPLNFVIRDLAVYQTGALHTTNIAYLYINYIGWVPILLALASIVLIPRDGRRVAGYLWLAIGLAIFIGSAIPLRWLLDVSPALVGSFRFPSFVVGLAVPPLLALGAWGLDRLLHLNWLELRVIIERVTTLRFDVKWFIVAMPLIWSVQSAQEFGHTWLTLQNAPTFTPKSLAAVRTSSAEWINVAYGAHYLLPLMRQADVKLSPSFKPWHWKDRAVPEQYLDANFPEIPATTLGYVGYFDGLYVLAFPNRHYAFITTGAERIPCQAQAHGGDIEVACETQVEGTLTVVENFWTGWQASREGQAIELNPQSRWLSVDAPAGVHQYEFHYRPWDVWVGLSLTVIGVVVCGWLWLRTISRRRRVP
jgi:hypothetical protein